MSEMNRDLDAIDLFCAQFREFCEEVEKEAKGLKLMASAAEGSLRDEVGQKAVKNVQVFADEILSIVYLGEQPIRELELRNQKKREDMEKVKGMIR